MKTCPLVLPLLAAALPAQAPPLNFRLLAHVNRFPGTVAPNNQYAGVWGFVGSNGREYAVVPALSGLLIYDCSNPTSPVEKANIPGPGGLGGTFWGEAQNYGNHVYVGFESGATQVINVSNPDAPVLVGTIPGTSHTITVDAGAGKLWINGGGCCSAGSRVLDLLQSQTNPPQVAQYTANYVHDALPLRGYCYLAEIFAGDMRILDIRNLPSMPILSTTFTPNAFTHNVWVTDDDLVAATCDETTNPPGSLAVYDISNKRAPVLRGTWSTPSGAVVHNVFIKSQVAIFSSYADGAWAIDISNPAIPTPIGQFDTTPLNVTDYVGCWGAYPFQPSGVIYLSDMQNGFWIVEPTCGVPKSYGHATAGTGGIEPAIDYSGGFARVNQPGFRFTGRQMRGGAAAVLALGFARGSTSVLGIEYAISLASPVFVFAAVASGTPGAAGAGTASQPLAIPNDVALGGGQLNAQWIVVDPAGPQGLAASQGFEVVICR